MIYLRSFINDKGVQDISFATITKDLFEEYRFYLKKRGLATATINSYLCWLSRLMYRAVSQRLIRCNPFENAKSGHIQTAADGQKYIRKERQKTKVEFVVPLHPIAEAIIKQCKKEQPSTKEMQTVKEKDNSFIFRTNCSRSVMGKNLCIVGKACGVRERLSYHMARHTFGTMSLSAGIPIKNIAKMMGHASISSTQIYA